MTEATLTTALMKHLHEVLIGSVVQKHADRFTSGVPDFTLTWNKCTTWNEVKFANPNFKSIGVQEITMKRLARAGHAWYIIYSLQKGERRTYFVHPNDFANWKHTTSVEGFNHDFVRTALEEIHDHH